MKRSDRCGDSIKIVEMPKEDSFEIDDPFEFWLIEEIIKQRKNKWQDKR